MYLSGYNSKMKEHTMFTLKLATSCEREKMSPVMGGLPSKKNVLPFFRMEKMVGMATAGMRYQKLTSEHV